MSEYLENVIHYISSFIPHPSSLHRLHDITGIIRNPELCLWLSGIIDR